MIELSKTKRKEIYEFMLDYFKYKYTNYVRGFCTALLTYETYNKSQGLYDMYQLPELMSFKPKDYNTSKSLYWFPISHTETRIDILYECIKMLNDESKSTETQKTP